jgi:two-component system, NtrC family, nitrogen regulation response regulator GlnG
MISPPGPGEDRWQPGYADVVRGPTHPLPDAGSTLKTLRGGCVSCVSGPDAGRTWQVPGDVLRIGAASDNHVVLSDDTVSRRHARLVRGRIGVMLVDLESRNGTTVDGVAVREVFLTPGLAFKVGQTELTYTPADQPLPVARGQRQELAGLVGRSQGMRDVIGLLEHVAATDLPILVIGETGTGKEQAVRALHAVSHRAAGPLRVVDCGALAAHLAGSDLFGHVRGAFTDAVVDRLGAFREAAGGTLLLDDVDELPAKLQPILLRVLDTGMVKPLGARDAVPVDARIVATTKRDLRQVVDEGGFREDLFFRLAVVPVVIPPLRTRPEDLASLTRHLLSRGPSTGDRVIRVDPQVLAVFSSYHWPGNVRELDNVLQRAAAYAQGDTITLGSLPQSLAGAGGEWLTSGPISFSELPFRKAKDMLVEAFERRYIGELLSRCGGNANEVARVAGIDRRTVARLLKKYDLRSDPQHG